MRNLSKKHDSAANTPQSTLPVDPPANKRRSCRADGLAKSGTTVTETATRVRSRPRQFTTVAWVYGLL